MVAIELLINLYKDRLAQRLPSEGSYQTQIQGLEIHRRDAPSPPKVCFTKPKIIVPVQGCKRTSLGASEIYCREGEMMIACIHLPNTSSFSEIKPGAPGMGMTLELDRSLLAQLILDIPADGSQDVLGAGVMVQAVEPEILNAFLRLEALLDQPENISVLAPMIIKEIHYRLLVGPNGGHLRALHAFGSQTNRVLSVINWLKEYYAKPVLVDYLADMAHMASCTFHRRFKAITSLSPLQYQKRLRLHEAQRLMIVERMDVGNACEAVGYESLTQFNREYKRLFGEPPRRNVIKWQQEHLNAAELVLSDLEMSKPVRKGVNQ